jgi:hypothetical protein
MMAAPFLKVSFRVFMFVYFFDILGVYLSTPVQAFTHRTTHSS